MASAVATAPRQVAEGSVLTRWMWTWVVIGIIVTLVVVGFLTGIVSALESIDDALFTADRAVSGAGGDVQPLPTHIENVNGTLGGIDTALKPVPAQADQIIERLSTIRGSLTSVDSSLKDTSGTLVGTSNSLVDTSSSLVNTSGMLVNISGSLVDTSNVLVTVKDQAVAIEATLEDAQNPPDKLGAQNIWERVAVANGILAPAQGDAGNILGGLKNVNGSLSSICRKLGGGRTC
jgi:hypothetical protein